MNLGAIRELATRAEAVLCLYPEGMELRLSRGSGVGDGSQPGLPTGNIHEWTLIPRQSAPGRSVTNGAAILVVTPQGRQGQSNTRRILGIYLWPDADYAAVAAALTKELEAAPAVQALEEGAA